MTAKKTTEQFKREVYELVGDEFAVLGKYVGGHTKIKMKHMICGREFLVTPAHFIHSGTRCALCNGCLKRDDEQFEKEVYAAVGDEYTPLSKYKNNMTKVLMRHNTCGYEWRITPASFLSTGTRCPNCRGGVGITHDDYIEKVRNMWGDKYTILGSYTNTMTPIRTRHNACGYEWDIRPNDLLSKRIKSCPKCSGLSKKTHEQFVSEVFNLVGNEYTVLGVYVNSQTHMEIRHNTCGNEYSVKPNKFLTGRRCPTCSVKHRGEQRRGHTIEDMKRFAFGKRGECLSDEYISNKTQLLWRCEKQHTWWAVPYEVIKGGTWCPECAHERLGELKRKYTIEDMRQIAQARGGECLSDEFVSVHKKLTWRCNKGHVWTAPAANVNNGAWCRECSLLVVAEKNRKYTIEDICQYAESKGGKCLSTTFERVGDKLIWECSQGHQWTATAASVVLRGSWCRTCANKQQLTIEAMRELAAARGGKCVSTQYINLNTQLEWECADGHRFKATPDNVKHRGSWCPRCTKFISEEKCRYIFEQLTGHTFPKVRNVLGNRYELDGYNATLHMAFEYQGRQHYEFVRRFYKTKGDLCRRREMDAEKQKRCYDKGINLITIPYWEAKDDEGLLDFIVTQLSKVGSTIYQTMDSDSFFDEFYRNFSRLNEVKKIAIELGGQCLSDVYYGGHHKLEFRCGGGHTFLMAPVRLKGGTWCKECKREKRRVRE